MNYFGSLGNAVSGMLYSKTPDNDKGMFAGMKVDDLRETTHVIMEENNALKDSVNRFNRENEALKAKLNVKGYDSASNYEYIISSLKTTFLDEGNEQDNQSTMNPFTTFLYEQLVFNGGLDEDDIYLINHFDIKKDEDIKKRRDMFMFKQMILERNYRELLRNIEVSKELNNMIENKSMTEKNDDIIPKDTTEVKDNNNNNNNKDETFHQLPEKEKKSSNDSSIDKNLKPIKKMSSNKKKPLPKKETKTDYLANLLLYGKEDDEEDS